MKWQIITLFKEELMQSLSFGVVGQALKNQFVTLNWINPREFAKGVHRAVDDKPFGGSDGMLMSPEIAESCILEAKNQLPQAPVYFLSPQGKTLNEKKVQELVSKKEIILLCGRYAGIDQRIISKWDIQELSIGDYVLSGGELAAAVVIDACTRKLPGVLGNQDSSLKDSFSEGLIEGPSFTRPREWSGFKVPEILLSGDHKKIEQWQVWSSWAATYFKRPDVFAQKIENLTREDKNNIFKGLRQWFLQLTEDDKKVLGLSGKYLGKSLGPRLAVGLVHYPILDREKRTVATNITNFDIHDIARASRVFGVEKYYIIHPMKEQLMFVERILDHWRVGAGSKFNPYRKTALNPVFTSESVEKAFEDWNTPDAIVVTTHARPVEGAQTLKFQELRHLLHEEGRPCFLLFGTGFGFPEDFMKNHGYVLESIKGTPPEDYRHLSVRSAVSICLDRLLGTW